MTTTSLDSRRNGHHRSTLQEQLQPKEFLSLTAGGAA
jgi:hypothetical protein